MVRYTIYPRELGPKKPKVPVTYMEQTHKQTNKHNICSCTRMLVPCSFDQNARGCWSNTNDTLYYHTIIMKFIYTKKDLIKNITVKPIMEQAIVVISASNQDLATTMPRLFQFVHQIKPSHQKMSTTSSQSIYCTLTVQGTALSLSVSPRNT